MAETAQLEGTEAKVGKAPSFREMFGSPVEAITPLEEAIKTWRMEEQVRDEGRGGQASQRKHIRAAINELASAIKVVAVRFGVSQSLLTKCMARHSLCWYRDVLKVEDLHKTYWSVYETVQREGPTCLRKQMEQINFQPGVALESVHVMWEIPNFVMLSYDALEDTTGVDSSTLLVYGMAWSLTTLEHREWEEYNINTYLLPEVRHMEKMLAYRRVDVVAFCSKKEIEDEFVPKS